MSTLGSDYDSRTRTLVGVFGLVAAGLLVLGSFLPWINLSAPLIGTVTRSGMDGGDGILTLGAGVVVGILSLFVLLGQANPRRIAVLYLIAGAVAGVTTVLDYQDVSKRISNATAQSSLVSATVGAGLWSLFVGVAIVGITFFLTISRSHVQPPVPPRRDLAGGNPQMPEETDQRGDAQ